MTNQLEIIYLALPYNHEDPKVRKERFLAANRAASKLIQEGNHVFSPISHSHPIAEEGDLPRGWDYWQDYDRLMLSVCTKLVVLKLDGWEQSVGVAGEISIAEEMGLPIVYIDPS